MLISQRASDVSSTLILQGQHLSIDQVHAVSRRRQSIQLTADPAVLERMQASVDMVRDAVDQGRKIYGLTTGFGSMVDVVVPKEYAAASQSNLLAFLAAGVGAPIDSQHVRGAMLLRANMLLRGVSGVRFEIVERLVRFLEANAVPMVREHGSIGASGDLVPLATVARAIVGHSGTSQVMYGGRQVSGPEILAELGYEPLELLPKEGLAIVNGTSFSSAIAANCLSESRTLLALSLASHALMIRALTGHEDPLLPFVHQSKPHPGQVFTARVMLDLLRQGADNGRHLDPPRVQDRYSLRCLPQYFGPVVEGLARLQRVVETEMNSITDNPLVDAQECRFYQSGNFLGQYISIAMDDLRGYLSLLAKHLDVQIAQLVSPEFSNGLPASLQGNSDISYNMGLKGLQITGNSIMPLLAHQANPLVQHYPTHAEQHNQNINGLSWGSANLAWRSVEVFRHYCSLALIFAVQGVDLRAYIVAGHYDGRSLLGSVGRQLYEAVYDVIDRSPCQKKPLVFNDSEQSLEDYLEQLSEDIREDGVLVAAVSPILDSYAQSDL
jgi:phenylalanine ammonia-lyase